MVGRLPVYWLRLQWPAMLLVLLLQRAPVLRAVLNIEWGPSTRIVQILQGALVAALAAGEVHAQAGATTISPAPGEVGNPGRGTVGEPFQAAVAIIGAPLSAASYRVTGELPPGLEIVGLNNEIFNGLAVPITGTPTEAGSYTIFLRAWNMQNLQGEGGQTAFDFSFEIAAGQDLSLPVVSAQPISRDVALGTSATFAVSASAESNLSYQWYRFRRGDSEPLPLVGATRSVLEIPNAQAADMGFYFVRVATADGSIDSNYATLTLSGGTSWLANLSTRGRVLAGKNLTPGFVLRGTGSKQLVIRAVGPELANFGVSAAMADPVMGIVPLGGSIAEITNDNWSDSGNAAELALKSTLLGAFPLQDDSRDAALLATLSLPNSEGNQAHTVQIRAVDGSAGIALAEVYDPDADGDFTRLSNISARGFSGLGADVLAPGFVIAGDGAKTMLIRVVGPTLADFGVPGTMADPRLEVIPGGQTFAVAANDDWGGTAELNAAFAATGAFAFPDVGSLDAAVLVRLPPGAYTVRPTGANSGTGEVLVEAYEVID